MGLVLPLTITVKGKGERFVWFQISLLLLRISAMLLTFPDMLNEKKKKVPEVFQCLLTQKTTR